MEWKECTIKDIAILRNGKKRPLIDGNIPVFGGNGIMDYVSLSNNVDVVIIGRVGAYCGCVHRSKGECWVSDNAISVNAKDGSDIDFLYYALKNVDIHHHRIGGAQPLMTQDIIGTLSIIAPNQKEDQRRIASILSSLDRKIELNNKINAQLEEMAQAIFKSWFVDFEPFKDGKFVESELGMIPEGWRVGTLTEIANYVNGLAMQKFPPANEKDSLPVLKIKELGQGQTDSSSDRCSLDIKPDYIINDGDVIFSWSGTLIVDIWCGGKCGLNQHLFKVTSNEYPKWFYLYWTKHHLDKFIRIAKDKAVTMGHIKRGELDASLVAIPDATSMKTIDSQMAPIVNLLIANRITNRTLSQLRDTLLPKLMSGEIDLDEIEKTI